MNTTSSSSSKKSHLIVFLVSLIISTVGAFFLVVFGKIPTDLIKGIVWGVGVAAILCCIGFGWFLLVQIQGNSPTAGDTEKDAATYPPLGKTLLDAFTHPLTWAWWLALLGVISLYSVNIITTLNWVWLPLILWMLFILFTRAKSISRENNTAKEKEKKPHPRLVTLSTIAQRAAFLATLFVIAYYGFIAEPGTWGRVAGQAPARAPLGPNGQMIIPEGIPLNPNFTSLKLANWDVRYIAANPQYRVPQAKWQGKKLILREEPGREVTEIVNLTVGFGDGEEVLDIHLSGACREVANTQKPQISKTCAGWWKDRGGKISGKFYLQVNEGGNRHFDIYLYDGNFLPKKSEFEMMISGPPISAIMLQFRPSNWNEDKND